MTDTARYEYIARATTGDGRVISVSRPRGHPLAWAPTLGREMLRRHHPDVMVEQLRRVAGSSDEWEAVSRDQVNEALATALAEPGPETPA